jgi:hypothetical protein
MEWYYTENFFGFTEEMSLQEGRKLESVLEDGNTCFVRKKFQRQRTGM